VCLKTFAVHLKPQELQFMAIIDLSYTCDIAQIQLLKNVEV
jgi:hypothetical protein